MILAGDIGGSKTSLALFTIIDGAVTAIAKQRFSSRQYAGLGDIVSTFLQPHSATPLSAACFGVAGAVIDGHCRTTNLPWEISTRQLKHDLQLPQLILINDLAATAYGMLHLPGEDLIDLNPQAQTGHGNCAVIAAGTGLGEALLMWDGERYQPLASEGGHCDFAPRTGQQDDLLRWLRPRFPGHVSYERILSGPGIALLYDFLLDTGYAAAPTQLQSADDHHDRSALISACALQQHDPLCSEALRLFTEIYAAEAGNLALKALSYGALYIGGGIAPKILPFMQSDAFMSNFSAKGRFADLLNAMPVRLSRNEETALIGAAHYARDHL